MESLQITASVVDDVIESVMLQAWRVQYRKQNMQPAKLFCREMKSDNIKL